MTNNDYSDIQILFQKYVAIQDQKIKDMLIDEYKKGLPQSANLIDKLRSIVDKLDSSSQKKFAENAFSNGMINMELVDNLQSQLDNRTTVIDVIKPANAKEEMYSIVSFYNFEKEKNNETLRVADDKVLMNDNTQKNLIELNTNDTQYYNYLIEKFFYKNISDFLLLTGSDKKYIASDYELPKISEEKLVKEDSLCETKEIQYLIDRILEDKPEKDEYLKMIFLDLITNQNYRVLSNGFGIINSDANQNDYYVLNGITIRKEVAIESLIRNYYDSIESITNIIVDNYGIIMDFIKDMIASSDYDNQYLFNLRKNIIMAYEKTNIRKNLDEIEFGENSSENNEERKQANEEFETNLQTLRKSLGLSNQSLNKVGYVSIFTIVSGITIFGVLLAYLLIRN